MPERAALAGLIRDRAERENMTRLFETSLPTNELAKADSALIFGEFVSLRKRGDSYSLAVEKTASKIGCSGHSIADVIQRVWKSHAIDFALEFRTWLKMPATPTRAKLGPDDAFLKVATAWGFGNGNFARLRKLLIEHGAIEAKAVKLRDTRARGWRRG